MPEPYSKEYLSIKRLRDLAYRLNFPLILLDKIAEDAEQFYRFRYKKKPNGKLREICTVSSPLKDIQKSIHTLLREIYLPENVHGGIKGKSNYTNAAVHCKKKYLLKLDLKDFFPSISHRRVYTLFRYELKCSPDVARLPTKSKL